MKARQFRREDFSAFVNFVATNAANRRTGHTYLMNSDIAWQFPGSAPKDNIRLWWEHSQLVGYAWFQPPDTFRIDIRFDLNDGVEIFREALPWVEAKRALFEPSFPFYLNLKSMSEWADALANLKQATASEDKYIVTSVLETDEQRIAQLQQLGFSETDHFEPILLRRLDDMQALTSEEFTVRSVAVDEFDKRVDLHVNAWAPSSGFTMERYLKIRAMPDFDPDLDIVAVTKAGDFASYTIAWVDPVSKLGSFEPFGTNPEFRGTGVSQLVINEGFQRMRAKGMEAVRLYTAGFNHQAQSLYRSCGFEQIDTNWTMIKML